MQTNNMLSCLLQQQDFTSKGHAQNTVTVFLLPLLTRGNCFVLQLAMVKSASTLLSLASIDAWCVHATNEMQQSWLRATLGSPGANFVKPLSSNCAVVCKNDDGDRVSAIENFEMTCKQFA
jgi:hypothetical protein